MKFTSKCTAIIYLGTIVFVSSRQIELKGPAKVFAATDTAHVSSSHGNCIKEL